MKFYQITLIVLLLTGISLNTKANPKEFSGVIVYNISYESDQLSSDMLAMMPKTLKMMIKGEKSKTVLNIGMGEQVTIFDSETMSGVTLIDMMGQKYAVKMTEEDIDKEMDKAPDVSVEKTGNTKEIAGYNCKEAIVKTGDGKHNYTVYYTDELGSGGINANNPYYKDIDGVLMEFAMDEDGLKMALKAVSVDKKKINDDEFEVPEGYKEVTQSELESMFGGGF